MSSKIFLSMLVAGLSFFMLSARAQEPEASPGAARPGPAAIGTSDSSSESPVLGVSTNGLQFKNLRDLKWDKIVPDLGEDSPDICILHIDPKTQATQLLIRTPRAIHVRKHWHTANETHTVIKGTATFGCDGKKVELSEGGFNFMPAKMVHEAWLPTGSLTFITVDGAWDVNWIEGPPTRADLSRTY
jgi:mannose-6-phosphate isomerase-like protein (cupin superfamily)